jgi:hypothetical protein
MKELQKQLESARAGYESLKYPGDLGAEMLGQVNRPRRWIWLGGIGALAAAAAVTVLVWVNSSTVQQSTSPSVAVNPITSVLSSEQYTLSAIERPTRPEMPASPGAFPSRLGISRPTFQSVPSWDALMEQKSSETTTQESV